MWPSAKMLPPRGNCPKGTEGVETPIASEWSPLHRGVYPRAGIKPDPGAITLPQWRRI